ncbi:MAG: LacI family DNA-binding transcriptional regulator [Verrucomicrobiia bacterium]|jgi:DNA-binding LacI/PurR family transcriptional regulator
MAPFTPKTRVTLSDVARKFNVSHTTVSRALRDDPQISKSLSQRIKQTAQQMGYRPDAMLSALAHYRRANKSTPIAAEIAWINHWPDPHQLRCVHEFDLYWQGAAAEADRCGYQLEEFRLDENMPSHRLERILLARNVPGILIPPWHLCTAATPRRKGARNVPGILIPPWWQGEYPDWGDFHSATPGAHLPRRQGEYPDWGDFHWEKFCVVRFGYTIHTPRAHLVSADQFFDSALAYGNIRRNGYQRIGLVTTAASGKWLRFLGGYLFAQAQAGAGPRLAPLLFPGNPGQESQPKLVAWLKKTKPDAILTDQAALRGMLARAGYRVPEDLGLATTSPVNGNADAGICQNSDEIGKAAIQLLISLIHHNERGIPRVRREVLVEGEWVEGSTLPPRNVHR